MTYDRRESDILVGKLQGHVDSLQNEVKEFKENFSELKKVTEENKELLLEIKLSLKSMQQENNINYKRMSIVENKLEEHINNTDKNPRIFDLLQSSALVVFKWFFIAMFFSLVFFGVKGIFYPDSTTTPSQAIKKVKP